MRILSVVVLFTCIALAGCHFLGPRDMSGFTMITDNKQPGSLNGVWKATGFSYDMIKSEDYMIDSIKLILHKDSTFEAFNLPDCLGDEFGHPIKHLLLPAKGRWRLSKITELWHMELDFDKGLLYKKGMTIIYPDLYLSGKTILMPTFVGDPDEAKYLEFEKVK
jgi:hypothetical protein